MAISISAVVPGTKVGGWIVEERIGTGTFATVWKVKHPLIEGRAAMKVIEKSSVTSQQGKTRLMREISLLRKLRHPFIAELFEVVEDTDRIYLIMEHVGNGNLLEWVNRHGRLPEDKARRYFEEMMMVLDFLHNVHHVCHRDVKAENVLIDRYNNIRLIDFGLSYVWTDENQKMQSSCGSAAYAPAEMLTPRSGGYTSRADIWSCGILLFAICAGYLPFEDANLQNLLRKIVYTEPAYPSHFSPALVDLLRQMLQKDPAKRISLEQIMTHPWFSATEYQMLATASSTIGTDDQLMTLNREVLDWLGGHGIELKTLIPEILDGDWTPRTALYRYGVRERLIENMRSLKNLVPQASPVRAPSRRALPVRVPARECKGEGVEPSPLTSGPKQLEPMSPIAGRRASKPQAVRRLVELPIFGKAQESMM